MYNVLPPEGVQPPKVLASVLVIDCANQRFLDATRERNSSYNLIDGVFRGLDVPVPPQSCLDLERAAFLRIFPRRDARHRLLANRIARHSETLPRSGGFENAERREWRVLREVPQKVARSRQFVLVVKVLCCLGGASRKSLATGRQ